jgi:small subunit ribosomal protein S5
MFSVPLTEDGSIPHEVMGIYGAGRVLIKPAVQGTGVMAGGPVRAIMELAGVKNVITKSLGTSNQMNIVKAAAEGLKEMQSPEQVANRRGITVDEMFGRKERK